MRAIFFKLPLFLLIFTIYSHTAIAQGISINNDNSNPDGSAMLHVKSTNKGILIPRMSTAQRITISSPATGLLVFDLTSNSFWFFDGSAWTELIAGTDNDQQTLTYSGTTLSISNGNSVNLPNGDITGVIAGDGLTGGGTAGTPTINVVATNGLTDHANDVRLGGTLIQQTTINQGTNNMNYNLNSSGDFHIQDAGVNHFSVTDNGDANFGSDVYWRDENTTGTILARLSDSGNDGIFDVFSNGAIQHRINSIGTTVFNEQGTSASDFRVESNIDANMLFVDASANKIGLRKNAPTHVLDIEDNKSSISGATIRVANKTGGGLNYQNGPAMVIEIPNIGYGERNVSGLFFNRMRENVEWVVGTEGGAFGSPPPYPAPSTEKFFIARNLKSTNAHQRFRPIYSNNTYFVINNNGTVGLGLTNPTYKLTLPNNSATNTGRGRAFAWNTYSDGRLKTNRKPITYGLNEIMQIEALSYDHHNSIFLDQNEDREFASIEILESSSNQIGFIAQDLFKIIPEAVTPPENEEADLWGVDYTRLIPVLVKATQEQQQTIEMLQSKNKSLQTKEKAYQHKLQQLEDQINKIEATLSTYNRSENK